LIQRGVEINREDHYQDTALDYLIYSPNFEMQTLLIENGATSGFLVAVNNFYSDAAEPPSKANWRNRRACCSSDAESGSCCRSDVERAA
jgi:ankyrin repeat protein